MDISEIAKGKMNQLSSTEEEILNYIVVNDAAAGTMSIRRLASVCYVSTATVLRFVRKLGFSGYKEFRETIGKQKERLAEETSDAESSEEDPRSRYLKNLNETVRMITKEKAEQFDQIMQGHPKIYILSTEFSSAAADYLYQLLDTLGYDVKIPRTEYELKSAERRIRREDVLLVLCFSGCPQKLVAQLEHIISISDPKVISITRAGSNLVQNMSDLNFHVYVDEKKCDGGEVTSRCGMIAVMEILLDQRIRAHQVSGR